MSLFDPPFVFRYRCKSCKTKHQEIREKLEYKTRLCRKCGRPMMETRVVYCGLQTDTTFMAGSDDGFGNDNRTRMAARKHAAEMGINISGKRWCPGMVDSKGGDRLDPNAWIGSKSEAKRKCADKGWYSEELGVTPDMSIPDKGPYKVCDEFVNEEIAERLGDETISQREMADLRESVTKELSGDG